MDPLSTVNKAYSMVVKFEFQREILGTMNESTELLVLLNKAQTQTQVRQRKSGTKKDHCAFCNMDGHLRGSYFKLIGYPEWYKLKNKVGKQSARGYKNTKMLATEEGDSTEEDNPLDVPDTATRINKLTTMLSSLK